MTRETRSPSPSQVAIAVLILTASFLPACQQKRSQCTYLPYTNLTLGSQEKPLVGSITLGGKENGADIKVAVGALLQVNVPSRFVRAPSYLPKESVLRILGDPILEKGRLEVVLRAEEPGRGSFSLFWSDDCQSRFEPGSGMRLPPYNLDVLVISPQRFQSPSP